MGRGQGCMDRAAPIGQNRPAQNVSSAGVEKPWVGPHAGHKVPVYTMEKNDKTKTKGKIQLKKKKFWEMSKPKGGSAAGRADMEWSHEQALSVRPRAGHAVLPDTGWEG